MPASPSARSAGRPTPDLFRIDPPDFDKLVARCEHWTAEELAKRFGMPFAEAETVNPALLVFQHLFRMTRPADPRLRTSDARRAVAGACQPGDRKGGPRDVCRGDPLGHGHRPRNTTSTLPMPRPSPTSPCGCSTRSGPTTAGARAPPAAPRGRPAARGGRPRNNCSHHKHSYYLIANSEIFGSMEERAGRRRGPLRSPQRAEAVAPGYMSPPRESRVTVSKLAAILRVADAFSRP